MRKKAALAIDRPFDPAVLRRAARIARNYSLIITPEPDVGFFGRTVEMPFVMADGESVEKCAAATLEATMLTIAHLLEEGQRPPTPASAGQRDKQINIRVSADEKLHLEELARREGYRSVSDYIRAAALNRAS